MQRLDEIDLGIIECLKIDGRMSNKAISQAIDTSEQTISLRIRSLQEKGIIRVVAQHLIPLMKDRSVISMVEIFLSDSSAIDRVGRDLISLPEIFSAYVTSRRPEIVAHCRVASLADLHQFVSGSASAIEGISQIRTIPVLSLARYMPWSGTIGLLSSKRPPPRDINEALVALLEQDGRQSVRSLAKKLELSETAVRQRLSKALEDPALKIGLVCDARALGYSIWTDIRMTVKPAAIADVMTSLAQWEDVTLIAHISGSENIGVFLSARSFEEIDEFVQRQLRSNPDILDFTLMRVPKALQYDCNYVL